MSSAIVGKQYQSLEQQHESAEFGMWIFLGTELMLFGGLFTGYPVYRTAYTAGFVEGSRLLDLAYAGPNTMVLLLSTLTMALAVHSAQLGRRQRLVWYPILTALLGVVFLGVKASEYYTHFQDGTVPGLAWTYAGPNARAVEMFFVTYFLMTGLHAAHLIVGICVVVVTAIIAQRGGFLPPARYTPVEMVGLYWHFIDVIWTLLLHFSTFRDFTHDGAGGQADHISHGDRRPGVVGGSQYRAGLHRSAWMELRHKPADRRHPDRADGVVPDASALELASDEAGSRRGTGVAGHPPVGDDGGPSHARLARLRYARRMHPPRKG